MRALVVVESMFGNTKEIAAAVADGLGESTTVDLIEVNDAPHEFGADLGMLVVGGPTHAFGMSRAATRRDAVTQAGRDPATAGIGIREWLERLEPGSHPSLAASFDTRIASSRVPGSAARAAQKRLKRLGFRPAMPAESFYVSGTPGPLVDGELERARRWGVLLGSALQGAPRAPRGS
jgi:hypothetical protein